MGATDRTMKSCLLVLAATLALATAGGNQNGTIGAPCKAGEAAIDLFASTDLMGKVAVITGADTGIGLEIARAMAARNATVVMACRKIAGAQAAAADIRRSAPHANIVIPEAPIDLSSLKLTRDYVISVHKAIGGRPVHWLVNDAAMSNNPHGHTTTDFDQNGKPFEMLFEVNYVAQFLLTELMLPQLRASGEGRVINLVSKAMGDATKQAAVTLRERFKQLDATGDGLVDKQELQASLKNDAALGELITKAGMNPQFYVLEQVDGNQDGKINWNEFKNALHDDKFTPGKRRPRSA